MICQNCQHENDIKDKFCSYCGKSLTEEQKFEQLKERSREMAFMPTASRPSQLSQWLNERPARYKAYPALAIIKGIYAVIGWLLVIGSLLDLALTPQSLEGGAPHTTRYIVSGLAVFIGFVCIASSEVFRLMMDMAENADRQSILLTMLYHKLSDKPKEKI
jgi:hypothetical protein